MNKPTLWLTLLPLPILLSGCPELGQHWDDKNQQIEVDFYRQPCSNTETTLCYRVRDSDQESFVSSQASWSGFTTYEWGNRYQLDVLTSFDNQGKPNLYDVQNIVSTTDMSSEAFALTLYSRSGILQPAGAGQWLLGSEITLNCADTCAELTAAVNAAEVVRLELSESAGELQVSRLLCRSAEDEVAENCDGESEQDWQVASFMSECGLAEASMCLLYRTDRSSAFELLRLENGISGFSFGWGSRFDLEVRQRLSNAGMLESATLITADDDPESFSGSSNSFLFILRGSALTSSSAGLITLYGGAGVAQSAMPGLDCEINSLCQTLNGYIANEEYLLLRAYKDETQNRLVLSDIACHNVNLTSFRSCVDDNSDVNWSI